MPWNVNEFLFLWDFYRQRILLKLVDFKTFSSKVSITEYFCNLILIVHYIRLFDCVRISVKLVTNSKINTYYAGKTNNIVT